MNSPPDFFLEDTLPFAVVGRMDETVLEKPFEPSSEWTPGRIVLGSFLGFTLLFFLFSSCCRIMKAKNRPKGFSFSVSQILVSETQAVIASFTGVKIVLQTWSDCIFSRSPLTTPYAMIFVGYLLYDLLIMYLTDWRIGKNLGASFRTQLSVYCHHVAFITVVPVVTLFLRDGKGDHFIGCFLIMEFPVIFLHWQHVLSTLGRTGSKLYIINGLLTLITYPFFRLAIWPFMFYRLALRKGVSFFQIYKHVSKSCLIGSTACLVMYIYWFTLMFRKACRVHKKYTSNSQVIQEEKSL